MNPKHLLSIVFAAHAVHAQAQSLSDAFEQGSVLGRSGNAAARAQISGSNTQSHVPGYTTTAPQAGYFGQAGLSTPAAAAANACTGDGSAAGAQACDAVDFTQTNPTRRPSFRIDATDGLLSGAKAITADPHAIAGNIAGTYSACSVQTITTPDRFETALCHQYRATETLTCDKVLVVTPLYTPGCTAGQFLTRVLADPCPACLDYLAFDFSCSTEGYHMHVQTIMRATGQINWDMGSQEVPGGLNTVIPYTQGPSQMDEFRCYETFFSQSCSGMSCTIGAWFSNPCQATSYHGQNTFAMPTTVQFTDAWDNQCAALEARTQ